MERKCDSGGSLGSTTLPSSSSVSVVLAKVDGAGLAVEAAAAEAMDATEGVVLMLGWQRPGMLAEVVQLYKGLLRRLLQLCLGQKSLLLLQLICKVITIFKTIIHGIVFGKVFNYRSLHSIKIIYQQIVKLYDKCNILILFFIVPTTNNHPRS